MEAKVFKCPNCGANIDLNANKCEFCGSYVYLDLSDYLNDKSLTGKSKAYENMLSADPDNLKARTSLGICQLKDGLYSLATENLSFVVNNGPKEDDALFYLSISLLNGKKPFLALRKTVDQIVSYLTTCISSNEKAIYYYFMAYIISDHHERKGYYVGDKTSDYYIKKAVEVGLKLDEVNKLHNMLNTSIPDKLMTKIK